MFFAMNVTRVGYGYYYYFFTGCQPTGEGLVC